METKPWETVVCPLRELEGELAKVAAPNTEVLAVFPVATVPAPASPSRERILEHTWVVAVLRHRA